MSDQINAPFTPEQVANLKRRQESEQVHPFTCCDHVTMTVSEEGFRCPKCQHLQTWCHQMMVEHRPHHI